MRLLALAALLVFLTSPVLASDIPIQESVTNLSGVAVGTSTFQQVQGANGGRHDCMIQNTGSHTQYIYLGTCANGTDALSIPLATTSPGNVFHCASPSIIDVDPVCLAGTANDTFTALFW